MADVSGDLVVTRRLTIPASELQWRFSGSGGPGGQHANTSNTKVMLTWNLESPRHSRSSNGRACSPSSALSCGSWPSTNAPRHATGTSPWNACANECEPPSSCPPNDTRQHQRGPRSTDDSPTNASDRSARRHGASSLSRRTRRLRPDRQRWRDTPALPGETEHRRPQHRRASFARSHTPGPIFSSGHAGCPGASSGQRIQDRS